jgi:UDP-GlcNAc:undecaprenyl-phosphate/decaprenyl-phosphate GlcNAc-1-phosphate transferase
MTGLDFFGKDIFITFIISFLISFASVPIYRRLAFKFNVLDIPGGRKSHAKPTPLLGGASILSGFIITFLIFIFSDYFSFSNHNFKIITVLISGSIAIFLLGLYDDIKGIRPITKLIFQIIIAFFTVYFGIKTSFFTDSMIINSIISIFWIVIITNAFNLLDNMDGLSSGVSGIIAILFFIIALFQYKYFNGLISILIAGAAFGFLPYNFNPAKIFLGDSGSLLLGYLVSCLGIITVYLEKSLLTRLPIITPIIILSIPLYDTLSVILIRIKLGISIFKGDKRHFSHRLINLGLSVRQAVLVIYLITTSSGLIAILLPRVTRTEAIIILLHSILMFLIIAIFERASYLKINEKDLENNLNE